MLILNKITFLMWILIAIIIIEWGGGSHQIRRLYEGGVKESWTKVDHGEEGVIRAQGPVDVFCAQPLIT